MVNCDAEIDVHNSGYYIGWERRRASGYCGRDSCQGGRHKLPVSRVESYGCVGEGTYIVACEDNLWTNVRRGRNQRSKFRRGPASLLTACRKM